MELHNLDHEFLINIFEKDILQKLTEREQYAFDKYYLSEKKTTLQEIGNHIHTSRERVRQILAKALKKIRVYTLRSPYCEELRDLYREL